MTDQAHTPANSTTLNFSSHQILLPIMAVAISQYDTSAFNKLPGFEVAGPNYDEVDGRKIIAEVMTPLFRKHGVEKVLGLQLLHQHFQLRDGEHLVDFNGTSVPIAPHETQLQSFTTSIWSFKKKENGFQLQPLELKLDSGDTKINEASPWNEANFQQFVASKQSFFEEYYRVVQELGIEELFGFARYPGDGFPGRVEISIGRTSINLTPAQSSIYSIGEGREAAWFFTDDFIKHGCKCLCPEYNGTHAGHNLHIYTVSG
ncbi:unnamed protein product [Clonostachys rosea f. rosea IK726]|uniref:Uncharacterized protein n=1 Tax=Clonostachys rosea f. rosea IK726 TaxID=1349383 RepID=A0ACA9TXK7_BIOOC|nr:unnamed protein product [Clonostachys rosea f. rosea IK726]